MPTSTGIPCPNGDGGMLVYPNNLRRAVETGLAGQFHLLPVKIMWGLAQGAWHGRDWLECDKNHEILVRCQQGGEVWQPEHTPMIGDVVVCPNGHKLI